MITEAAAVTMNAALRKGPGRSIASRLPSKRQPTLISAVISKRSVLEQSDAEQCPRWPPTPTPFETRMLRLAY